MPSCSTSTARRRARWPSACARPHQPSRSCSGRARRTPWRCSTPARPLPGGSSAACSTSCATSCAPSPAAPPASARRLFPSLRLRRSMAPARRAGKGAMEACEQRSRDGLKLFVVDPHTIYRRGLAACLEGLAEAQSVGQAGSVRDAWADDTLFGADVVLVDHAITGGLDFVACSSLCDEDKVLAALQAGAAGVLRKETLTTEALANAVRAAASGTGVVTSELLHELLDGLAPDGYEKPAAARLTDREQQVLSLIANGHPTREVAQQLCYSERTVKNVLHDVVTKLNARSRSQAVAHAVREGLI